MKQILNILASIYAHQYNKKYPIDAIFRVFNWYLRKYIGVKTYQRTFWGYQFILWLDSHQSFWLNRNVVMDWEEFCFMQDFLRDDDIFLDIGANVGVYSFWASQFVKSGKIYSFEPNPKNADRFKQIYQMNLEKTQSINLIEKAVTNLPGVVAMTTHKDQNNQIVSTQELGLNEIHVEGVTLSDFFQTEKIDHTAFVKIDVEGYELDVLEGAVGLLSSKKIDVIQVEINQEVGAYERSKTDLVDFLTSWGYNFYTYNPSLKQMQHITRVEIEQIDHRNYFALQDKGLVEKRIMRNYSK